MPNQHRIAKQQEWDLAKAILAKEMTKGELPSGFKIHFKQHPGLNHSFIYLLDENNKAYFVSLLRSHLIGRGCEGTIKLVEDESGKLYAVKHLLNLTRLQPYQAINPNIAPEASILKRLNRFFICAVGGPRENKDPWIYLLLSLEPGLTLKGYVKNCNPLTDAQKGALAYHLAVALYEQIHAFDIEHNDLTENNVMIHVDTAGNPIIRLIDFGCAIDHQLKRGRSKSSDFSCYSTLLSCFLKWTNPLLDQFITKVFSQNDMRQIIADLDQYKHVPLPIPDNSKRLVSALELVWDEKYSPKFVRKLVSIIQTANELNELTRLLEHLKSNEANLCLAESWTHIAETFQSIAHLLGDQTGFSEQLEQCKSRVAPLNSAS